MGFITVRLLSDFLPKQIIYSLLSISTDTSFLIAKENLNNFSCYIQAFLVVIAMKLISNLAFQLYVAKFVEEQKKL